MSWKSETRRTVEDALDRLANGEDGHANIAAELEELSGVAWTEAGVREMSTIFADGPWLSEDYGMELLHAVKREMFGFTPPADRDPTADYVWRVVLAREIERGLLG
jgi:hypothetical protein